MKKKILIGLCVVVLIIIGIVISKVSKKPQNIEENTTNTYAPEPKIVCQIKGEVVRPGFYSLEKGSKLQDLIFAAGGFTSYADINSVEMDATIQDNYCYTIDKISEDNLIKTNHLININIATKEELMSLSGIGEAKALAIIEYREKNGNFNSVNDLTKVNGISEKILSQIIDLICTK